MVVWIVVMALVAATSWLIGKVLGLIIAQLSSAG
jgi:hypothetical protein